MPDTTMLIRAPILAAPPQKGAQKADKGNILCGRDIHRPVPVKPPVSAQLKDALPAAEVYR
jgi:hypothetical protein